MSRVKFLALLSAALLLTNIMLVAVILLRKGNDHHPRMPREIIIERLHFSDAQIRSYDELIAWHRSEIRKTDEEIISLKTRLYEGLSAAHSLPHDSLLEKIGALQMEIEKIHYKHFQDIKNLCTSDQIPYFEQLLKEIAVIFSRPAKGPPPR